MHSCPALATGENSFRISHCDDSLISHALTYNEVEKEDRKSKIEKSKKEEAQVKSPREGKKIMKRWLTGR
jgi:hypothetical protein